MGESDTELKEKLNILQTKYKNLSEINEKLLAVQTQGDLINDNNEQISFLGMGHVNINKKLYTALISLGNIGLLVAIIFLLKKNNNGNL